MHISKQDAIDVFKFFSIEDNRNNINKLSDKQRKVVDLALKSIKKNTFSLVSDDNVKDIVKSLSYDLKKVSVDNEQKSKISAFFKGVMNRVHLRVSSQKIKDDFISIRKQRNIVNKNDGITMYSNKLNTGVLVVDHLNFFKEYKRLVNKDPISAQKLLNDEVSKASKKVNEVGEPNEDNNNILNEVYEYKNFLQKLNTHPDQIDYVDVKICIKTWENKFKFWKKENPELIEDLASRREIDLYKSLYPNNDK